MAWTTPKTFTAASVLTAAEMNTYVSDNTAALAARAYFVPLTTPLTSTAWDGDSYSTTPKTKIDLSSVFSAPAGIKAVLLEAAARDSGSAGKETLIRFSPNDTTNSSAMECYLTGRANDQYNVSSGICPCDANGDIYYQITASGANSMDVYLRIWGYWL